MARRMLIDATHPEETRVVVLNGNRLEEFDFETSTKKQIKGNIYLAKVTRVEPSLQAAFVEYGGNRHGFLAFSEIHPDYYRIPVGDREAMLAAERYDDEHGGDDDQPPLAPHEHHEQPDHDAEGHGHDHGDDDHGDHDHEHAEPEPAPVEYPAPTLAASDGITVGSTYAVEIVDPAPFEASPDAGAGATDAPESAVGGDSDGGSSHIEQSEAAPITVETVGGDDFEEVQSRPRTRHYRSYKIQEVIKRRQILLIQVTKEERGNKGAALTTYLSLAGR